MGCMIDRENRDESFPREQRAKAAQQVFTTGPFAQSRDCVDLAYEDVRQYIISTAIERRDLLCCFNSLFSRKR